MDTNAKLEENLPKGQGKMRAEEWLEQHKAQWADTPNNVDYTRQQARATMRREEKAQRRRAAREVLMARFAETKARRAERQAKEAGR